MRELLPDGAAEVPAELPRRLALCEVFPLFTPPEAPALPDPPLKVVVVVAGLPVFAEPPMLLPSPVLFCCVTVLLDRRVSVEVLLTRSVEPLCG